jgi:AcrR family transcriptional regulator
MSATLEAFVAPGLRERAKDERRMRIVKAAAKLLAERTDGSFSMQELAARAGLSPATPYNLFGTKTAILQEVFRIETEGFRRNYAALRNKPPVERVLAAVDQILSVYVRKPQFFRGLSRNLGAAGRNELEQVFFPLLNAMFEPLVSDLAADGAFSADIPPNVITTQLTRIFEATFLHWSALDWDEDYFGRQLRIGFAITFLGFLGDADREALLQVIKEASGSW